MMILIGKDSTCASDVVGGWRDVPQGISVTVTLNLGLATKSVTCQCEAGGGSCIGFCSPASKSLETTR